jgi:hypothetical protein
MTMKDEDVHSPYAGWDVLAKWSSPSFDDTTRAVLSRRLGPPSAPRFFEPPAFATLEAACARLLDTPRGRPPIANAIDDDLFQRRSEGYRTDGLPPDDVLWRGGIAGLEAEARRHCGCAFAEADTSAQDEVLHAGQRGDVDASAFAGVPPKRFFVDALLKAAAGHFYGRPEGWSEIGFGGPASPRGYVRIGLDRRDPWEAPRPVVRRTR